MSLNDRLAYAENNLKTWDEIIRDMNSGGDYSAVYVDPYSSSLGLRDMVLPGVPSSLTMGDPSTAGGYDSYKDGIVNLSSRLGYVAPSIAEGIETQYGYTNDSIYAGDRDYKTDWLRQANAQAPLNLSASDLLAPPPNDIAAAWREANPLSAEEAARIEAEYNTAAGRWNTDFAPMSEQDFLGQQLGRASTKRQESIDRIKELQEQKAKEDAGFLGSDLGKALAIGAGLFTGGIGALGAWAPAAGGAVTGGLLGAPSGNFLQGALTGGALAGLGSYGLDYFGGADGLLGSIGEYVPSGITDLFGSSDGMIPFGDKTLQAIGEGITPTFEGAGIAANPAYLANSSLGGIAPALSGLSATNALLPATDFSFASTLGGSVPSIPMPGTHANGYNLNLPTGTAEQITPYFEGAGIGTPEPGVDYGELAKQGLKMLSGAEAPVQGGVATSNTAPFRGGQFNPTAQQARFQGAQLNPLLRRF